MARRGGGSPSEKKRGVALYGRSHHGEKKGGKRGGWDTFKKGELSLGRV